MSENPECLGTHELVLSMHEDQRELARLPRSLFLNQPEVGIMPGAELLLALLDQLLCSLEITLLGAIDRLDVA